MESCIFIIGTVTQAIHARRLLGQARIPARLIKNTKTGAGGGCAYGLAISMTDMPSARRALDTGGIPYEWKCDSR